jgi:hypothetical protein
MELKHRWATTHNFLAGLTARAWWQLLRENRFAVSPAYWHRAAFVTLASLMNSASRIREESRFGAEVDATEVTRPPVFILGHWRSGTTHLHNLLSQDRERFAFPNTYQVVNPHTFLTSEEVNTKRFARLVPDKRPMDNMKLGFGEPQEDEFAPALSTLLSPYFGVAFPRREEHYERYLTFEGVPEAELEAWKASFLRFVRKLTLKNGDRTLLLKSPAHTARIRILLEIFPDARFVHIHRHPHDVFRSFLHYYDTAAWFSYLQVPDRSRVRDTIINRYRALYDAFLDQRSLIPAGHFHELSFTALERDPLGSIRELYEGLSLGDFTAVKPTIAQYLSGIAGYRKNEYPPLAPEDREDLAASWHRCFAEWGYEA